MTNLKLKAHVQIVSQKGGAQLDALGSDDAHGTALAQCLEALLCVTANCTQLANPSRAVVG